ncbi:MAG: ATP-dependent helicase [Actinomycetota bacterium]|nr:ATP-dependent helicase [Actinomycetota bacterium]
MPVGLTTAQRRAVAYEGRLLRVRGGAGTGKTTALVHRYLRLAAEVGAHRVLVLSRNRGAAERFRRAVLPHLSGGFQSLPVTTAWGLAFDVLRRAGLRPRLVSGPEQWSLVRELLASEGGDPARWPTLHPLVGRRAFADEVAGAVLRARSAALRPEHLREAAAAGPGSTDRWLELAAFVERYQVALVERGLVDGAGLLTEACALLGDDSSAETLRSRHPHVLVDDYEAATPAVHQLVRRLMPSGGAGTAEAGATTTSVTVAGNPEGAVDTARGATPACFQSLDPDVEVVLEAAFRRPAAPMVVRCRHPSTEPEAVAGELLAAHDAGVEWEDMAVLVRGLGRRARAISRALERHGIPVAPTASPLGDDPAVRSLIDLLRWVNGDAGAVERLLSSPLTDLDPGRVRRLRRETNASGTALEDHPTLAGLVSIRDALAARVATDDVAMLAHRAFRSGLGHLVHGPGQTATSAEERALDAVRAFLDGVSRHVEQHPGTTLDDYLALLEAPSVGSDPWVGGPATPATVTVTSIAAAAGQEWHTVVVAGCVEGELPRVGQVVRFFEVSALSQGGSGDDRHLTPLQEERRLFASAADRATGVLVGVSAPEPGVLLSRFVEGWQEREPQIPLEHGPLPVTLPPTAGTSPMWPDQALRLSASQLDTYQDCPLKHAYRYGLGVRGPGSVHANLGNLVHAVLDRFCDPTGPVPAEERTRDRLHQVAEECWSDDLAPFRPQLEEARRDLFAMLDLWWEHEGGTADPPVVLATEHPFAVEVGPHRLSGRIDRVDRSDDGKGLRVVDYKSGKHKPRPADVAGDLQLATYHLGASLDAELAEWGPVRQLRLLHLRTMTPLEQEITPGHARATEEWILAVADRIRAEEMGPEVDADCDHCEFHRLCPLWPEGREVGQG